MDTKSEFLERTLLVIATKHLSDKCIEEEKILDHDVEKCTAAG